MRSIASRSARLACAIALALLPVTALAQQHKGPATARSEAEQKHDSEIDQAYRAAIRGTDDKSKPVATDPWHSIRPADGDAGKHASQTGTSATGR